jgi:hypothetical protein
VVTRLNCDSDCDLCSGTPALLVGDSYLAFFHSSGRITHKSVITYVMGAYLFQR